LATGVLESTITRTRGHLFSIQRTAASAGDGFAGAIGIGIVSEAAFDGGITTVPTPITEMSWDGWLYHRVFQQFSPVATASIGSAAFVDFDVDSKAMRKMGANEVLYAVIEMVEIGAASIDVFFDSRVLFKLG